jgi:cobalt-zinc-cadmium efflux system outer membrane protein
MTRRTRTARIRLHIAFTAMLTALPAAAQTTPDHLDLPDAVAVERVLGIYPPVRAARDAVRAEIAGRRRLDAGPYEFIIRGGYQNHNMTNGRFPEYDIGVERGVRLPGKARVDGEIGAQNVELARRISYSAWCDGARHLLKLWFGWARENVQLELWTQQAQALREQVGVVTRRAAAGDAPRVEVNLAEAAASQAESLVENFRGRENGARGALDRTFPGLAIPRTARIGSPRPLENTLDWFIDRVRLHNDEIRVVRAASKRAALFTRRAEADHLPDPSIGARISTDRSSQDKIAGVYLSVPIPGQARRAFTDSVRAMADSAASNEAAVVQRVTADVALMDGQARGAFAAWRKARDAAEGMRRNADSMLRSWQLREASLNEVLVARRLALESGLAAALAQIDAEEARYKLLIEAHLLWNDPEEEAEDHRD